MKKLFSFIALLGLAVTMSSCENDPMDQNQVPTPSAQPEISISASVGDYTRATDTAFEVGDQVGLYVILSTDQLLLDTSLKQAYVDNALFELDAENNLVNQGDVLYWYEGEYTSTLVGYYPYQQDWSVSYNDAQTFEVAAAQNEATYFTASDLMIAQATSAPTEEAVALNFKHQNVRICLSLTNNLEEELASVTLGNITRYATVTPVEGVLTVSASGKEQTDQVVMGEWSDYTWNAILPTQTATPKVTVTTVSGASYYFDLSEQMELVAGKKYTASITLEKPVTPDPEPDPDPVQIEVAVSWTISDWEVGGELEFVQSDEAAATSCKIYVLSPGWSKMCFYAWDSEATLTADWPGDSMTTTEINGLTYYVYDAAALAGKTISMIFNNSETLQTVDITNVTLSGDLYYELAAGDEKFTATMLDANNLPIKAEDTWSIIGAMTSWASDIIMTKDADSGLWCAQVEITAFSEFKFRANGGWDAELSSSIAGIKPNHYVAAGSGLGNTSISVAGTYDIYLDTTNNRIYVMEVGTSIESATEQTESVKEDLSTVTYGLVGGHNNWSAPDTTLTWDGSQYYVAKGVALEVTPSNGSSAGFKIRGNEQWNDSYNYGATTYGATVAVNGSVDLVCGGASQNILVPADGTYDVYFDLTNLKLWLMEEGKTPSEVTTR